MKGPAPERRNSQATQMMMMTVSASPRAGKTWDRAMPAAAPRTPSARFSQDVSSGMKARTWVEEVIGRSLPEGDFAAGFKDGVGLCELVNVLRPGTITKIEKSASPFHQMANISCFLRACRAVGVREQALFETLVSDHLAGVCTTYHTYCCT